MLKSDSSENRNFREKGGGVRRGKAHKRNIKTTAGENLLSDRKLGGLGRRGRQRRDTGRGGKAQLGTANEEREGGGRGAVLVSLSYSGNYGERLKRTRNPLSSMKITAGYGQTSMRGRKNASKGGDAMQRTE